MPELLRPSEAGVIAATQQASSRRHGLGAGRAGPTQGPVMGGGQTFASQERELRAPRAVRVGACAGWASEASTRRDNRAQRGWCVLAGAAVRPSSWDARRTTTVLGALRGEHGVREARSGRPHSREPERHGIAGAVTPSPLFQPAQSAPNSSGANGAGAPSARMRLPALLLASGDASA